ncbi:MAG: hypothetical protein CMI14_08060, partial [Oleispira sp.]|nr:hypothetical protein [Oleispira sp.]
MTSLITNTTNATKTSKPNNSRRSFLKATAMGSGGLMMTIVVLVINEVIIYS